MKKYIDQNFFDKPIEYQNRIIGLLLIMVGIIFLYNPINFYIKISASMILIGFLIFFQLNEKHTSRTITGQQINLIIISWLIIAFIVTINNEFDIFLFIVILGILTIKEFLDGFMSLRLKKRIFIFSYFLIFLFILILGQRIINILGI